MLSVFLVSADFFTGFGLASLLGLLAAAYPSSASNTPTKPASKRLLLPVGARFFPLAFANCACACAVKKVDFFFKPSTQTK